MSEKEKILLEIEKLRSKLKEIKKKEKKEKSKEYRKKKYKQRVFYVPVAEPDPDRWIYEKLRQKFESYI